MIEYTKNITKYLNNIQSLAKYGKFVAVAFIVKI